ncbi:MAG TPA: NAD(P)-dependent oxidoreductase [Acidimicrobiales bacterium]|nr:NAD(P)-dependent oxidoreductase [Acidimicrobiales bacterium]
MLSGERIVVTGAAGQIGFPLADYLARDNEVVGVARLRDEETRARLVAAGIKPTPVDLASGDLDDIPSDATYVVHLAAYMAPGEDFDLALRVNAEGTGLLLQHCRSAKAALVMSTHSVYRPHDDPMHVFAETDPLGEVHAGHSPTYSMSKIGQEAVARTFARAFGLPVTLARMNVSYGPNGGLAAYHLDSVAAGYPVTARFDPAPYSPIHQDDINEQTEALLAAASVPATIVNWAGDEVVTVQDWCALGAELSGREANVVVKVSAGKPRGQIADVTRRLSLTGPCKVPWREGMTATFRARHPS